MTENKNVLWLETDGEDGYVSELSRLFGPECRMALNLDNGLVVTRGSRVVAEAKLGQDDRITAMSVDEVPAGMARDDYFKAAETFIGRKVLYRQR